MPFYAHQFLPLLPEAWLAVWTLVLLMVGAFSCPKVAAGRVAGLTSLGFLIALLIGWHGYTPGQTLLVAPRLADGTGAFIRVDDLAFFAKATIYLLSAFALPLAASFLKRQGNWKFEYPILMLLSVIGMSVMVGAHDLLTLYLGLEMMSFTLYILAAFMRDEPLSSEAGLKYFVLGSLASGVLLFGISLLYGAAASTGFADIALALQSAEPSLTLQIGMVMMLVAMAFKISAVPFHMWTPDVYQGAPTPVTAFMASAPKVAAVVLLMRVLLEPLSALQESWQPILAILAILSMVFGSLGAIVQSNIKRLLAYSAIAQVGFMLVGLTVLSAESAAAVVFYLMVYGIMTIGLFSAFLLVEKKGKPVTEIADLAGLGQKEPFVAALLLIGLFSLAGVPPLVGFFAKFLVFKAAVAAGYSWLAIIGVLSSVIAAYYSLSIIKIMFFEKPHAGLGVIKDKLLKRVALVCALAIVGFGILPSSLMIVANQAVIGLF
jgi:NADH-quinone oxidoreductase subunit N